MRLARPLERSIQPRNVHLGKGVIMTILGLHHSFGRCRGLRFAWHGHKRLFARRLSGVYRARFHRRLDRYVACSCFVFARDFHAGTWRGEVSDCLVDHRLRTLCRSTQPLDSAHPQPTRSELEASAASDSPVLQHPLRGVVGQCRAIAQVQFFAGFARDRSRWS